MQIEINKFVSEIFYFKLRSSIYFLTIFFSIIQLFISSFDLNILIILFFVNLISIINLEISLKRYNYYFILYHHQ